jgi:hypothetical protein
MGWSVEPFSSALSPSSLSAHRREGGSTSLSIAVGPIQEAFSKVKALRRKASARTRRALVEAIGQALKTVTPRKARDFFGHCGYRLQ